ncbi:hypothetical protein EAY15_22260, partial [Vibrio anguillarum]
GTQESFVGNVTITSAYNDQDYSKAKQIFLLAGRVEDNKALISRVDAISVSRDEALAQSLSLISVEVGENTAKITSEQTARVTADEALAQDIQALAVT